MKNEKKHSCGINSNSCACNHEDELIDTIDTESQKFLENDINEVMKEMDGNDVKTVDNDEDYEAKLKDNQGNAIDNKTVYFITEIGDIYLGKIPVKTKEGEKIEIDNFKLGLLEYLLNSPVSVKDFVIELFFLLKDKEDLLKQYIMLEETKVDNKDFMNIYMKFKDGLLFFLGQVPMSAFNKAKKQAKEQNKSVEYILFLNTIYNYQTNLNEIPVSHFLTFFYNLTLGYKNVIMLKDKENLKNKTAQENTMVMYDLLKTNFLEKTYTD